MKKKYLATIIMLILVIVLLIFVYFKYKEPSLYIEPPYEPIELPNPSPDSPISIISSRLDFRLNGTTKIGLKLFNNQSQEYTNLPSIICKVDNRYVWVSPIAGKEIYGDLQHENIKEYVLLFKIKGHEFVQNNQYSCRFVACNDGKESVDCSEYKNEDYIFAKRVFIMGTR